MHTRTRRIGVVEEQSAACVQLGDTRYVRMRLVVARQGGRASKLGTSEVTRDLQSTDRDRLP